MRAEALRLCQTYLGIDSASPSGLVWKINNGRARAGSPAFASIDKDGYFYGQVRMLRMRAHQVVFLMTHGYLPEMVDHKDGVKSNNEPGNLRASNALLNQHNRVDRGVTYSKGRKTWVARIQVNKVYKHIGYFKYEADALAAYAAAKKVYHPECLRNNHDPI